MHSAAKVCHGQTINRRISNLKHKKSYNQIRFLTIQLLCKFMQFDYKVTHLQVTQGAGWRCLSITTITSKQSLVLPKNPIRLFIFI